MTPSQSGILLRHSINYYCGEVRQIAGGLLRTKYYPGTTSITFAIMDSTYIICRRTTSLKYRSGTTSITIAVRSGR